MMTSSISLRGALLAAALAPAGLLLSFPGCGGDVVVDGAATAEVTDAAAEDAATEDAGPTAPPQCLCPNAPGYAACVKPFECCPTVGVCENPATFNCSGSTKTCP
jgi:hypothetical protein